MGRGKRLEALNRIEEGMNENHTVIGKPFGKKEPDALKPIQHPRRLHDSDSAIISYKVPPKNLTPYYNIPDSALAQLTLPCKESPEGARSLELCLLGAPNAGKSSLLNNFVERQISAVSNKASTTDEATLGVYTCQQSRTQLLMYDTPGFTKASNSLRSKMLVTKAWDKITDCDHALFVVDAAKRLGFEVREAIKRLQKVSVDPRDRRILQAM